MPREKAMAHLEQKVKERTAELENIEEKQATIQVEKLPTASGIEHRLQQVFQNLLRNSLKFSPWLNLRDQ